MELTKHTMFLLSVALLSISVGCASAPSFPGNGAQALHSESEFGVLTADPDSYQGRAIKLAGRIVGVESTKEGILVLAEWLPFPSDQRQGPSYATPAIRDRFELFYPGKIDEEGLVHGNKFLVIGKVEEPYAGAQKTRFSSKLPHITAECLHVWKSGNADIDPSPDSEFSGYPLKQQTYCSEA